MKGVYDYDRHGYKRVRVHDYKRVIKGKTGPTLTAQLAMEIAVKQMEAKLAGHSRHHSATYST